MKCAVKRGIVVLRDCGNQAGDTCIECTRAVCQEHTKFLSGDLLCVECHARRLEQTKQDQATKSTSPKRTRADENNADWEDSAWPYYYRHHYYTHYGYSPFYHGHYYDGYYDQYDVRGFDEEMTDINELDDEAGGIYDS